MTAIDRLRKEYRRIQKPPLANNGNVRDVPRVVSRHPGADCQRFGVPPVQLEVFAPLELMQLLLPRHRQMFQPVIAFALLQDASALAPYIVATKTLLVHVLFHVVSECNLNGGSLMLRSLFKLQ